MMIRNYIIFFVVLLVVISCTLISQRDNNHMCCNDIIRRQCVSCHTIGKSNHSAGNVYLGEVLSLDSTSLVNKITKAKNNWPHSSYSKLSLVFDSLLRCTYYVTDCNEK
jgi:hypothetical protein